MLRSGSGRMAHARREAASLQSAPWSRASTGDRSQHTWPATSRERPHLARAPRQTDTCAGAARGEGVPASDRARRGGGAPPSEQCRVCCSRGDRRGGSGAASRRVWANPARPVHGARGTMHNLTSESPTCNRSRPCRASWTASRRSRFSAPGPSRRARARPAWRRSAGRRRH